VKGRWGLGRRGDVEGMRKDEAEADTLMKLQRKNKVAVVETREGDRGRSCLLSLSRATSAIWNIARTASTLLYNEPHNSPPGISMLVLEI
jgi:hypothetical protein